LSLRISKRRQQYGVASLQIIFVFIPILIVTSLRGSGVIRGGFSVDGSFFRKRRA
jgi:hypothetical protein